MEQEQLKCNPNVQAVSEKAITYTDEFKRHFIAENEKGKFPREIFENAGLDVELIGIKRIILVNMKLRKNGCNHWLHSL